MSMQFKFKYDLIVEKTYNKLFRLIKQFSLA